MAMAVTHATSGPSCCSLSVLGRGSYLGGNWLENAAEQRDSDGSVELFEEREKAKRRKAKGTCGGGKLGVWDKR